MPNTFFEAKNEKGISFIINKEDISTVSHDSGIYIFIKMKTGEEITIDYPYNDIKSLLLDNSK